MVEKRKSKIIRSFKDLEVYQEGFQLQLEIDEIIKYFPQHERYLLVDQLRRASRSIPAIIAEGWARRDSAREFKNYLKNAYGETCEMINHLMLVKHKKYIKKRKYDDELIKRYEILSMKITKLRNNRQKFK